VAWSRRFILFHGKRHPRDMGAAEVVRFLEHVAGTEPDAVNALLLAHEALAFLYRDVLHAELPDLALPQPPRLLDRLRLALRVRRYSRRVSVMPAAL
jgi:hypothetical protein